MTDYELLLLRTETLGRVIKTKDTLTDTLDRVVAFAKTNAIGSRALGRGDEERRWLDLIYIVEHRHPTP